MMHLCPTGKAGQCSQTKIEKFAYNYACVLICYVGRVLCLQNLFQKEDMVRKEKKGVCMGGIHLSITEEI